MHCIKFFKILKLGFYVDFLTTRIISSGRMTYKKLLALLIVCIISIAGCQTSPTPKSNTTHLTLWQGVNPPSNRDVLHSFSSL